MAKHDDQTKKPNGDQPKTPKPAIPNMSLDEPVEVEPLEVEEVLEEDIPVVLEAAPDEPIEVLPEEIAEAEPIEDEILAAEPVVEAAPEVDLLSAMEDDPGTVSDADPESPAPSFADLAAASAPIEPPKPSAAEDFAKASEASGEDTLFDAAAVVSAPESEIVAADEPIGLFSDSDVVAAEEPAHAASASDIVAAHEPIAQDSSGLDLFSAKETKQAAPISDVAAAEEVIEEAAPVSDVAAAEEAVEVAESAPESGVLFDEAVGEATPASEAKSAEEVMEAAEEVSSATRKSEAVLDDEVAEAEEVASAASYIEEAVAEEEVLEAEPAAAGSSVVLSDALPMGSSAVAQPPSEITKTAPFEQTMAFQPPASASKKADDDDLLVTEEEMAGAPEASAVDLGDMPAHKGSSVTGIDKVAEALESGLDLGASDDSEHPDKLAATVPSVEFDELLDDDSGEGELPPAKKKPAAKKEDEFDTEMDADLAEEEAVPAKKGKPSAAKATGDDIDLDDLFGEAEAEEAEAEEAEAEEAEAEAEEAAELDDEVAEPAENLDESETAAQADDGSDETEAAESFDEEDAEETEAAESFDDELEGTEALDAEGAEEAEAAEAAEEDAGVFDAEGEDEEAKPTKKKSKVGAKGRAGDDEEEEALADEDEDELAAKKKKGKKAKAQLATTAPAAGGYGCLTVIIGMFLVAIVLIGGIAAGGYFAPVEVIDFVYQVHPDKKPPPPKPHVPTALENAHKEMDQGKFGEAVKLLADAKAEPELAARGEAQWFAYVQSLAKDAAPDGANPEVKKALDDLKAGKNDVMVAQIRTTLDQKATRDTLAKAIADKDALEKALKTTEAEKVAAEKRIESAKEVLVKGNYIKKDADFDVAVLQKLLKSLSEDKAALDAVNTILDDAKFKAGADGLKDVLAKKKDADENVAAVNKVLEDEKIKDQGAKGVLKIVAARNLMAKERDGLAKTIGDAFKELVDGKIAKEGADPVKEIVAGAKLARQKAESPLAIPLAQLSMSLGSVGAGTSKVVEQGFDMARVFSELGYFRTREPFIQTPEQKMNNYVALLQDRKRNNPKELAAISREADWVRSPESKASADSRAKASYVQALALRNAEKFAEAKAEFAETLKMMPKLAKAGTWNELALRSYKELTDPNAYYLPRITALQADGKLNAALAEANTAIKAIPNNSRLFARRALIRYEQIQGKGPKTPAAAQQAIRADAAKAPALAAESAYIVGLLEEEIGNVSEAEKLYRQAIKLHPIMDDAAGKYRVALARLLLRDREPVPAAAPPADDKKGDKVGAMPSPERVETIVMHPWTPLIVSAAIAQEKPFDQLEDKATIARLNETLKLAEELIASKNSKIKGQGLMLKGSALSRLGKRTEGLKDFTAGLKLVYPGIETKEMSELVADHPAFQQPDISETPNPIMAEKHFGEGIHHYWAKQYPEAEAQFRQAVRYYDKDARYYYYLGLAQLEQRTKVKRDAAVFSIEQGARLEAKMASTNPEAVREINASLERIQGSLRQYLNAQRYRITAADPEGK